MFQNDIFPAKSRTITLAIAGDVMLGRMVNAYIPEKGFAYPWGNVLPVLKEADLFLINLEFTLTSETRPWDVLKAFNFRAEPSVSETLKLGRVDFASVANNHVLDFGPEGLRETLEVLDEAGIAHAGSGIDTASAQSPAILTANGTRIAVVAFADYPADWAATHDSPGTNYTPISVDPDDFKRVESALSAARQEADMVIFSIHWGPNMRERPPGTFREFARKVVTSGADIFWGHSAHVVQGIEVYNEKLILYDTGDFVDDYAVDAELRNDLSALFLVTVDPLAVIGLELVPVEISQTQVNLAKGADYQWIVQRLTGLSEDLGMTLEEAPQESSIPVTFR